MAPVCSILMAAYNTEKYIAIAIVSVLKQTFNNWEFIIVDDGSDDFTYQIANSFKDERIKVYKLMKNKGKAHAMKFGLRHCNGKYILELDADDWLDDNCLETLIGVMEELPYSVAMIYGDRAVYKEVSNRAIYSKFLYAPDIIDKYHFLSKMEAVGPRFYRTTLLKRCGGWNVSQWGNERLYEDVDVILRIMERFKLKKIKYTGYNIRKHESNITKVNRKNWWWNMKMLIDFYVSKWGNEVSVLYDDDKHKVYFIDLNNST